MLDQSVVNLAKAIRQHETGNRQVAGASGELSSRYQFLPSTWKGWAKRYLGSSNAPLSLENENKVSYMRIKEWKDQGYNPAQIASMWNSGSPNWEGKVGINKSGVKYDVPKYVNNVFSLYKQYKAESEQPISIPKTKDEISAEIYNPVNPYKTGDTAMTALGKTVSNMPTSFWNFTRGVFHFFNPIENVGKVVDLKNTLNDINQEAQQGVESPSVMDVAREMPGAAYEMFVPKFFKSLFKGDLDEASRIIVNDPFNQIAPVVFGLDSGVKAIKGKPIASKIITKQSETAIGKTAENVKNAAQKTGEYAVSQATGLQPKTIETIVSQPEKFSRKSIETIDRTSLAEDVFNKMQTIIEEKSDLGKGYEPIRTTEKVVNFSIKDIKPILDKFGIKIDKVFDPVITKESIPMSSADVASLGNFLKLYASGKELTANAFLNARQALANMAKYDAAKTNASNVLAREIRVKLNELADVQLPELRTLDKKFESSIGQYKQIMSEYLTKDKATGEIRFKDGAITRIANATNKGRNQILERLEKIKPGITEEINIVRAIENIKDAQGKMVGAYGRPVSALIGYGLSGAVGAVLGLMFSSPTFAVYLLRLFGQATKTSKPVIEGVIKNMKNGKQLTAEQISLFLDMVKIIAFFTTMQQQQNEQQ